VHHELFLEVLDTLVTVGHCQEVADDAFTELCAFGFCGVEGGGVRGVHWGCVFWVVVIFPNYC
jgi:hypothetical protein